MAAAPIGVEPAAIALFEHDIENYSLRHPRVIPLVMKGLTIHSSSVIWHTSIMRKVNQEFPKAAITLKKDKDDQHCHRLTFPVGAENLKVMVDYKCLDSDAMKNGCLLQGGELVRVYTTYWLKDGEVVDEWAGPLSFQYRSPRRDYNPFLVAALTSGKKSLDHLQKFILRMIFAYLPVDEVLHVIPAVCSKFLHAVKEETTFHQWEIARGCPTTKEAAFYQGWTAQPITNLALSHVPLTTTKEWHCLSRFLQFDLINNKNYIQNVVCNLATAPPGKQEPDFEDMEQAAVFRFLHLLANFPQLQDLKVTGLHFLPVNAAIFNKCHKLKRLSVQFGGRVLYDKDSLAGPLILGLKTVCFIFEKEDDLSSLEVERFSLSAGKFLDHIPENPFSLEHAFGAFAPASKGEQQRILVLVTDPAKWDNRRALLTSLKELHALSLTVEGQLVPEVAKTLINSIPPTVQILKFMMDNFDDDLCQAVADRCPHLEALACNGTDVTEVGVQGLVEGCKGLKRLFLLKKREDGVEVAKVDDLPKDMAGRSKRFEKFLRGVFG